MYDKDSSRIIISFGMDDSGMQEDMWILDLPARMWSCWCGSHPTCKYPISNTRYSGPGKIAFPSQVQTGLYVFIFGGASMKVRTCAELGKGATGVISVPENVLDMWAMDISTLTFLKVTLDSTKQQPRATFLSSMVAASEFLGFKEPLVLAGGAELACLSLNPPCSFPTPSHEIWIMDTAPQESTASHDKVPRERARERDREGERRVVTAFVTAFTQSPS